MMWFFTNTVVVAVAIGCVFCLVNDFVILMRKR